ncbi:MAG: hypothetical protein CYPHOPRED_004605, partial [Cyphobasidiales sp. Tagirdzhanova-0007]
RKSTPKFRYPTGASRNIGLAFVKQLAKSPENTVIAVNRSPFKEAVQGVSEIRADISDLSSLQAAVKEIDRITGGALDVLLLNAGGHQVDDVPLAQGREEELAEVLMQAFRNNTVGNLQLISLTLPLLRKGNMKKIFAMTSGNGVPSCIRQLKLQGRWPYATTKGALDIALIRLSNELHSEGFTVVSISPAVVFDRTGAEEKGLDFDQLKATFSAIPGSSGICTPDEGAKVMLGVMDKMTERDTGRVVGMWAWKALYMNTHERGYRVRKRERGSIAYSGPDDSKISTIGYAGDVDAGKAWKKVRRASDIDEHRTNSKNISRPALRVKRKKPELFGKFSLNSRIPLPSRTTYIICELGNGRQLVTTPAVLLKRETGKEQEQSIALIAQDFELIAEPNQEITLSFKIRRDRLFPFELSQQRFPSRPSQFSVLSQEDQQNLAHLADGYDIKSSHSPAINSVEPILQHLSHSGEIARVVIKAAKHMPKCTGQKVSMIQESTPALGASIGLKHIAEVGIQLFHLPPMAEVPHQDMPQQHRGLRPWARESGEAARLEDPEEDDTSTRLQL